MAWLVPVVVAGRETDGKVRSERYNTINHGSLELVSGVDFAEARPSRNEPLRKKGWRGHQDNAKAAHGRAAGITETLARLIPATREISWDTKRRVWGPKSAAESGGTGRTGGHYHNTTVSEEATISAAGEGG